MRQRLVVYDRLSNPEEYPLTHALEDQIEDLVQELNLNPQDLDIAADIRVAVQIVEQFGEYEHGCVDPMEGLTLEQMGNVYCDIVNGIFYRISK